MTASAPTPAPTPAPAPAPAPIPPLPPLPPPPARVTAVVPARNEAARIGATVTELRRHVDEVVVVDDASDDATGEVAAGAGAVVVRNERRLGYVGSIRRGFAVAGGDVVVTVDADGEMPVERIAELVAPIVAGEADMVQGHRSRVPRLSERLVTAVAALGGPVGDSGSGFRALRTGLACALEIPGSCICGSLALDALGRGARLAEIPIAARHVPGRRRRIAWNHLGQVAVVAGMVLRARLQDNPPADPGLVGEREVHVMRQPRPAMTGEQMRQYLTEVGARLAARGLTGEIILAGGAVMVMALGARGGSRDIDAVFAKEAGAIGEAAGEVAKAHGLPVVWLNDHVRVFVAPDAPTVDFFDVPGLRVRMVRLDYLFYMKAWAGDPIDQRDLLVIAKALELTDDRQAHDIVRGYSSGELPREVEILLESLFE